MRCFYVSLNVENMYEILFLANAIGAAYEIFLVPFAYFALAHHAQGFVEMVVVDRQRFETDYSSELGELRRLYPNFMVRNMRRPPNGKHMPNTYRFFEVPETAATYTFTMDVDVMLLDNIVPHYEKTWPAGSVVNNIIRPQTKRLTGMHMVRSEQYFTRELLEQQEILYNKIPSNINDEVVLCEMVRRCHTLPPIEFQWRPILGIHFSPNRGPQKSMDLKTSRSYASAFLQHSDQQPMLFSYPAFRRLVHQLETLFLIK